MNSTRKGLSLPKKFFRVENIKEYFYTGMGDGVRLKYSPANTELMTPTTEATDFCCRSFCFL